MLTAGLTATVVEESVRAQPDSRATGATTSGRASAESVSAQQDSRVEPVDWRPCGSPTGGGSIERIERAEILLVVDRSSSLENVDPGGNKRRGALERTREELTDLQERLSRFLGSTTPGSSFDVDVALIAFNVEADQVADLDPVGSNHPSGAEIAGAATSRGNTDYGPAIQQALEQFESSPYRDSEATCRILVLFTDGILDPYDTAAGRKSFLESRAESHVSELLEDLCSTDPGSRRYRDRMDDLGISTYVAVLKGWSFDRGAGITHLDGLALASKQAILALTGHADSPLLGGVAADPGCRGWSENRAGKVVDFEDIDGLAVELANAVGNIESGLRQPRIGCRSGPGDVADLVDEWPHALRVSDSLGEKLCTVTAPLDGTTTLTLAGRGEAAGVEWLIDDGITQASSRRLSAGDANLSFDVVSTGLPGDRAFGGFDAEVEVVSVWSPESQPGWLEQPLEDEQVTTVRFGVPDRERQWIDRLIQCRVYQRATWVSTDGGDRAEATPLCEVQAPPAGEFEVALESPEGSRRSWSATRSVGRGDPILLAPGDRTISLGAAWRPFDRSEIPHESFDDVVTVVLVWRSPRGAVLASRPIEDVNIEVRPASINLLECTNEAQVTGALAGDRADASIAVVDTGCTLLSPPRGTVTATVSGDLGGVPWELADRPTGATGWRRPPRIDLDAGEPNRRLFVLIEHPELAGFVGSDGEFSLITGRSDEGIEIGISAPVPRSVAVYLPGPRCPDRVEADLADTGGGRLDSMGPGPSAVDTGGGGRLDLTGPGPSAVDTGGGGRLDSMGPGPSAAARNICRIDPPPNGHLEVRIAEVGSGAESGVEWRPVPAENQEAVLSVLRIEAGDAPVAVDAVSGPLSAEMLPMETRVDVEVTWTSTRGYRSRERRRVVVGIPDIRQNQPLLRCPGTPGLVGSPVEVPTGPLVVDTGCVLVAPDVGTVTVDVGGDIAGTPWRLGEEVRLGPGDDDFPILIRTADPLRNRGYDTVADFALAATWLSPSGVEQGVGDHPSAGQEPQGVEVVLRARPDTGAAALIAGALLLAGLVIVWLVLGLMGRRANRLPRSGEYRVVRRDVTALVASGGTLELDDFDVNDAVTKLNEPLVGGRSRLRAAGLTIATTVRWWSPGDLLSGGRARAVPQDRANLLVAASPSPEKAASPSSEKSDCLPVSLAHGAVVVALNRKPTSSGPEGRQHRGRVWILVRTRATRDTDATFAGTVKQNIDKALGELRRSIAGRSVVSVPNQPKG